MKQKIRKILKELYKEKDKEKGFEIVYKLVLMKINDREKFKKEFTDVGNTKEMINLAKMVINKNTGWKEFREGKENEKTFKTKQSGERR